MVAEVAVRLAGGPPAVRLAGGPPAVRLAGGPPAVRSLAGGPPAVRSLAGGPRGLRQGPELADNAMLVARELLSPTVVRLTIRPDGGMAPFVAGQYLALGLQLDGRLVQRPYSTASDPSTADAHTFLVRQVPDGVLTPRLWQLPVGARLRLGQPKGRFNLVTGDRRAHLFVATGTGLAPFLSMLRALRRRPDPPQTILVHGAARVEDLVCRDDIAALGTGGLPMTYVPTVSRPDEAANGGWTGRTGRAEAVLGTVLREADLTPGGISAYLCGNPGMVAAAEGMLLAHGVAPDNIHAERYWIAATETAAPADAPVLPRA